MVYEDDDEDMPRRSALRFGVFKKIVYGIIILDILAMFWYFTRH